MSSSPPRRASPPTSHRCAGLRPDARTRSPQAAVAIGSATTASALVAFTQTGTTARRLAARRPPMPLIAFTPDRAVQHQLALSWGVEAFIAPPVTTTDEMIRAVDEAMRTVAGVELGDTVVVVAGTPPASREARTASAYTRSDRSEPVRTAAVTVTVADCAPLRPDRPRRAGRLRRRPAVASSEGAPVRLRVQGCEADGSRSRSSRTWSRRRGSAPSPRAESLQV